MHAKTACGYCKEPKRRSAARTTFASTGIVKRWPSPWAPFHYVAHLARIALPPTPSQPARTLPEGPAATWRRLKPAWGGILEAPKLPRAGVLQRWRGPTLDRCGHVTKKPSTQMHGVTHHPAAVVRDPWMRSKIPEQTIADPSVLGRIMSVFAVVFRLVESTQALSSLSSARTLCMADHEVAAGFWRQTMTATPTSGAAANCRHSVLVLVVCPEPRAKRRGEGKRDSDALSGAGLIAYCMSCMREPRLMATASSAGIEASKGRCNKGHHKAASFGPSELKGDGAAATPAEKHSSRLCTQKKR
ncbi:uncharacterized protein TRIVIDRAFT_200701 [Trichoderma virens Gv29-8]|uniref:Uncharacterized protein n=1 Tax=Hypocrea virens (strain Gv29-8 / FGSC 10586) TaxID=413071 RepID=G9MTM8_HYPVG|nr:uncharacterized protein TRIVIDRAFT_200701 [Trichoderma virens Gv29-8]EHK22379.1 hypothetical protein TRIVIDRAFT_200701 [Trichoderma virens Gv29-8]